VEKEFHLEIIQVKEKREQRQPQVGFSQAKPQERVALYGVFCIVFLYVYMGLVETSAYMQGVLKVCTYTSKNMQIWVVQ
jgi:hypothetical protein